MDPSEPFFVRLDIDGLFWLCLFGVGGTQARRKRFLPVVIPFWRYGSRRCLKEHYRTFLESE